MPLNLIKKYPELLELIHLDEAGRKQSLYRIFRRDIEENTSLLFKGKMIRPAKTKDGESAMQTLFHHLIARVEDTEEGKKIKKRVFEMDRAQRLHWILHHFEERTSEQIFIFSFEDRTDGKERKRTYIYDKAQKYVIILELQESGKDYYFITAYYLNEKKGINQIEKKFKNKLPYIF